jgi:hypothetical protein
MSVIAVLGRIGSDSHTIRTMSAGARLVSRYGIRPAKQLVEQNRRASRRRWPSVTASPRTCSGLAYSGSSAAVRGL